MADWIREAGSIAAATAALLGLIALIAHLPPVRWLSRRVISDPITQAFRREVAEVVDEQLTPIKTQVEEQTVALKAHLESEMGVQEQIEARLGRIEDRIPPKETP
jgi:hypothetical protein